MPIFRYTFKKILVSPSTWIVFILTVIILGLNWGLNASGIINNDSNTSWTSELVKLFYLSSWKGIAFSGFIGLMLLIFIGIKSVQIFRDEIEDGTLLILVSKPISRNRIWFEKWLSFQTIVISYIFLSIFLASIILMLPGIGDTTLFVTLLPYLFILFGIALIFDLIFTSTALLISLVLNAKATIAITIMFAALSSIFASGIDGMIRISKDYFALSQAVAVYHQIENKVSSNDLNWFKSEQTNNSYINEIEKIMKKVYQNSIIDIDYPNNYSPEKEQLVMNEIANGLIKKPYTNDDISLIKHIINISNVFRQWKEQSYQEIMTGVGVGKNHINPNSLIKPGDNGVNYTVENVFTSLNKKFTKQEINDFNSKISQKRISRYFNIFYQWSYLFNGIINEQTSLYVNPSIFQSIDDPYLISFNEVNGQVDSNSGNHKIINFPVLISIYVILGLGLLAGSWYLFNRRDFT